MPLLSTRIRRLPKGSPVLQSPGRQLGAFNGKLAHVDRVDQSTESWTHVSRVADGDAVIGAPTDPSRQVEVALGFHRTLEAGDFDAFEANFTADAVNELPFHSPVSPASFFGACAIAEDYRKMIANRRDLQFTIHSVTTDESANRVIVEFSGRSIIGETGALYEQDYVGVFTIDGSRISRLRLYADPQRAAKALGSIR